MVNILIINLTLRFKVYKVIQRFYKSKSDLHDLRFCLITFKHSLLYGHGHGILFTPQYNLSEKTRG